MATACMMLYACTANGRSGIASDSSLDQVSQLDTGAHWNLAPDPCHLFGSGESLDLGDGTPILRRTEAWHLAAMGQRYCAWGGADMAVTISFMTEASKPRHSKLEVNAFLGEPIDIGLEGSSVTWWTNSANSGTIAHAVYGNVKISIATTGTLNAAQQCTLKAMLADALVAANRAS